MPVSIDLGYGSLTPRRCNVLKLNLEINECLYKKETIKNIDDRGF